LRFKICQPITMGIASPKRGLPMQRIEIACGWSLIRPDPVARDPPLDLRTHPDPHKRFRTHCCVIYEVREWAIRVALRKPIIHCVEHIFIGTVLVRENSVQAWPNASRQRGLAFRTIVLPSSHNRTPQRCPYKAIALVIELRLLA